MLELLAYLGDQYQSGETLAKALGVSRMAVWKKAEALREAGYPLEVVKGKGYRLRPGTPTPEALEALREGELGQFYCYLGSAGSTQDVLKAWALDGAAEGAVVLAERQEKGRGRRGRSWMSAPGSSLTFSVLLRPSLPLSALPLLPLAAGLALREATGVGGLKWPNDLLSPDGRKLAGVLLEAQVSGEEVAYVILGIGLNVHRPEAPGTEAANLAYLDEFVPTPRVELLARFLERLEARYAQLSSDPEGVLEAYRAYSYTLGREVRVATPQGEVRGQATAIEASGSLIIESSGQTHRISSGDVEMIGTI